MRFLRYPGGKGKFLSYLINYLPKSDKIENKYIEPFVGGGSVYLHLRPKKALISDLNNELIDLYKGIRNQYLKVWEEFEKYPNGKKSYYKIRDSEYLANPLYKRAARTLYLNRTCFKGMWRHSASGKFNVGYGGDERRWAVSLNNLKELSLIFRKAEITKSDFEETLNEVRTGDFVFIDPPYKPGDKEMISAHYINGKFSYEEQVRLAEKVIKLSEKKRFYWLMTNSNNKEIVKLYKGFNVSKIPFGTGNKPGIMTHQTNEVLISNY